MKARILLIAIALQFNFDYFKMLDCLKNKVKPEDKWIKEAERVEGEYITMIDADYPENLKKGFFPPIVIKK